MYSIYFLSLCETYKATTITVIIVIIIRGGSDMLLSSLRGASLSHTLKTPDVEFFGTTVLKYILLCSRKTLHCFALSVSRNDSRQSSWESLAFEGYKIQNASRCVRELLQYFGLSLLFVALLVD